MFFVPLADPRPESWRWHLFRENSGKRGFAKPLEKRFEKIKNRIGKRSGVAAAVGCLAPLPFPFTMVTAATSALGYPLWRVLGITFTARTIRFAVLGFLAVKLGHGILHILHSSSFYWSMVAFIGFCVVASGISIWHWIHIPRKR